MTAESPGAVGKSIIRRLGLASQVAEAIRSPNNNTMYNIHLYAQHTQPHTQTQKHSRHIQTHTHTHTHMHTHASLTPVPLQGEKVKQNNTHMCLLHSAHPMYRNHII